MDDDPTQPGGEGTDPDGNADADPAPASVALTPEAVRNSPEFRALARENRTLRRTAGSAEAAAAAARTAAEEARQAAEAQQQAALEADILATLGPDGIASWTEIAELSATDQRAAARRFAELMSQVRAQSAAEGGEGEADPDPAAAGGNQVPAQTPPPPARGVDGGAPLQAAPADDPLQVIAALEKNYNDTVERVQDPVTRNRVTMKDRAGAFINFVGAAYLKAGATPRQPRA